MERRASALAAVLVASSLLACAPPNATDGGGGTPTPVGSGTPTPTPTPTGTADGTPTRQACTSSFGNGISGAFGRLDGYLVSIVPPGSTSGCNDDGSHVHLQILMNGAIYDVAVNVSDPAGVYFAERDLALPDGAWSEGFHSSDTLDYVALGLHSTDFTAYQESALSQMVESELATANHVSIFATPYNSSGIHLVHRNSGGNDGSIVINPLSSTAHALFFHFVDQTF